MAVEPSVAASEEKHERRSLGALRHRNFTLLWSSLIISNTGSWMHTVGQGWLVLQLTDRPLYLGLVALAFALPMTFLPPLGGAIADRVDRLVLLRTTQTLQLLNALLLAVLTLYGVVEVWHILALAFVGAALLAVDNPTRQAMLPSLVGRADLMSAISLNSVVYTGAALFGPALGGFLLARVGSGGLFLIDWGELRARKIEYWVMDLWQVLPPVMKVVVGLLALVVAITVAYTAYQVMAGG